MSRISMIMCALVVILFFTSATGQLPRIALHAPPNGLDTPTRQYTLSFFCDDTHQYCQGNNTFRFARLASCSKPIPMSVDFTWYDGDFNLLATKHVDEYDGIVPNFFGSLTTIPNIVHVFIHTKLSETCPYHKDPSSIITDAEMIVETKSGNPRYFFVGKYYPTILSIFKNRDVRTITPGFQGTISYYLPPAGISATRQRHITWSAYLPSAIIDEQWRNPEKQTVQIIPWGFVQGALGTDEITTLLSTANCRAGNRIGKEPSQTMFTVFEDNNIGFYGWTIDITDEWTVQSTVPQLLIECSLVLPDTMTEIPKWLLYDVDNNNQLDDNNNARTSNNTSAFTVRFYNSKLYPDTYWSRAITFQQTKTDNYPFELNVVDEYKLMKHADEAKTLAITQSNHQPLSTYYSPSSYRFSQWKHSSLNDTEVDQSVYSIYVIKQDFEILNYRENDITDLTLQFIKNNPRIHFTGPEFKSTPGRIDLSANFTLFCPNGEMIGIGSLVFDKWNVWTEAHWNTVSFTALPVDQYVPFDGKVKSCSNSDTFDVVFTVITRRDHVTGDNQWIVEQKDNWWQAAVTTIPTVQLTTTAGSSIEDVQLLDEKKIITYPNWNTYKTIMPEYTNNEGNALMLNRTIPFFENQRLNTRIVDGFTHIDISSMKIINIPSFLNTTDTTTVSFNLLTPGAVFSFTKKIQCKFFENDLVTTLNTPTSLTLSTPKPIFHDPIADIQLQCDGLVVKLVNLDGDSIENTLISLQYQVGLPPVVQALQRPKIPTSVRNRSALIIGSIFLIFVALGLGFFIFKKCQGAALANKNAHEPLLLT